MFIPVSEAPVPYVLESDRKSKVQTVWHLRPMGAEEAQIYNGRWLQESRDGASPEVRGKEVTRVDREKLFTLLNEGNGVENAFTEGDHLKGDEINRAVMVCDLNNLQELLRVSKDMAALTAGAKK